MTFFSKFCQKIDTIALDMIEELKSFEVIFLRGLNSEIKQNSFKNLDVEIIELQ